MDQEVDEELAAKLFRESQKQGCYAQGLSYLARSEHTTFHLIQKLTRKGYPKEIIDHAVSRLTDEGALSDLRYARLFIERRQRKNPEGRLRLAQRLADRRVRNDAALQALDELFTEEHIAAYVARAVNRAKTNHPDTDVRNLLRAWGFSSYEIRTGLERACADELS
ncbi:MAG TPA: regulatory protein RecX [Sphaerochaeta sp.]|nr:regulatory protein RecX [Sphaerochaeta sp.]HPY44510.1 regulatory protein RecX [Sphaerochaeta sp.]HQB06025.1 regulatory protein RecX [Sphaerochaeta sp.]